MKKSLSVTMYVCMYVYMDKERGGDYLKTNYWIDQLKTGLRFVCFVVSVCYSEQ